MPGAEENFSLILVLLLEFRPNTLTVKNTDTQCLSWHNIFRRESLAYKNSELKQELTDILNFECFVYIHTNTLRYLLLKVMILTIDLIIYLDISGATMHPYGRIVCLKTYRNAD